MARQWHPTKKKVCNCNAETTSLSTVIEAMRGEWKPGHQVRWVKKRSQMVRHRRGDMHFWHWKDQDAVII